MGKGLVNSSFTYREELDSVLLHELYEDDYRSVLQVFTTFLQEMDTNIRELERVFIQGNLTSFKSSVHRLKPLFSYVGLSKIYTVLESIETQCERLTNLEALAPVFDEAKTLMTEAVPMIGEEAARLTQFFTSQT